MYNKPSYKINIIGEFNDASQEYEYQQYEMKKFGKLLKTVIILMETLNLLFLLTDFSRYEFKDFKQLALVKIIYLAFVIILKRADQMLYLAKEAGRNCVRV